MHYELNRSHVSHISTQLDQFEPSLAGEFDIFDELTHCQIECQYFLNAPAWYPAVIDHQHLDWP